MSRGKWTLLIAAALSLLAARPQPALAGYPAYFERECSGDPDSGVSYERAVNACTRILNSGDVARRDVPYYLYQRGAAYGELGQYEKAIADFDTALLITPGDANLYNARCWANARSGRSLFTALTDCDTSLQLRPGNPYALDSRAFVYFRRGEYAQARADLDAALAQKPKLASSLYMRGLARLKTGDKPGGDADIAAAKAIDAKIADTYSGYGVAP